ncbi:MAG: IS200/IS605 family transposase [Alphaproteobacteria bacterium]|nr:IS200/IS605 family transposase [Alphaproteobacteria bacterium]
MAYRRSSHSIYNIEYHIVFCAKCRHRILYRNIAERCMEVISKVCSVNYVDIINENISPDHVHMLPSAPPHLSIYKGEQ